MLDFAQSLANVRFLHNLYCGEPENIGRAFIAFNNLLLKPDHVLSTILPNLLILAEPGSL